MARKNSNLVWLDLEMTGLIPEKDRIIEIATIVTDEHLNIIAQGPVLAIHQPNSIMNTMDDWNTKVHGSSGLVDRVKMSPINEAQAEQETLAFLSQWVTNNASPLCGNSIGQDRRFLYRYMPNLESYFHYRNIDVSTIKELAKRWSPHLINGFDKKANHQALDDVKESIAELKYYRKHFFNLK